MPRYLVTGSRGYIGSHLMNRLSKEPDAKVFGLSREGSIGQIGEVHYQCDLLLTDLAPLIEQIRPDVIFHVAGLHPLAPLDAQLMLYVEGTRRLLDAVSETSKTGKKPQVVIAGSAAEYGLSDTPVNEKTPGCPGGEYGICKLAQTQLAQLLAKRDQLPVSIGRIFNVYGQTATHLVVASLACQVAKLEQNPHLDGALEVMNLKSQRDFIHIDDVVDGLIALPPLEEPGEIYNIAGGVAVSIQAIAEQLITQSSRSNIQILAHAQQNADTSHADIGKIQQKTGWKPQVSLNTGLARELDVWRAKFPQALAGRAGT